jgi:hypothetical protein
MINRPAVWAENNIDLFDFTKALVRNVEFCVVHPNVMGFAESTSKFNSTQKIYQRRVFLGRMHSQIMIWKIWFGFSLFKNSCFASPASRVEVAHLIKQSL